MFGSYMGHNGWFPETYVQLEAQPHTPNRPRSSPVITHSNSIAEENDLPSFDANEEAFHMMGGSPGDLFEGAPKPVYYEEQQQHASPTFLKDEREEAPVDIYRHGAAPKKKFWEHKAKTDYSAEISVQITSQAPPSPEPTYRTLKQVNVSSPNSTADFWKAHPGRTGGVTAEQATELERGFTGLRDSETIEIVVEEKKKKRWIPKSIKKAAQKTVNAVKQHGHH